MFRKSKKIKHHACGAPSYGCSACRRGARAAAPTKGYYLSREARLCRFRSCFNLVATLLFIPSGSSPTKSLPHRPRRQSTEAHTLFQACRSTTVNLHFLPPLSPTLFRDHIQCTSSVGSMPAMADDMDAFPRARTLRPSSCSFSEKKLGLD
jgi:hypothetical protein